MSKGKQTTLLQTWGYEGNSQFSQKTKTSIEDAFKNDDFDDAKEPALQLAIKTKYVHCF